MRFDKSTKIEVRTAFPRECSYVLISPAKDEERHIETTIKSVLQQTVRPSRWIIVDDGSQDKTAQIIDCYTKTNPWIQVLTIHRDAERGYGSAEIRAFALGFQLVESERADFIVKLDSDLDLPPDYFERLIARFNEDPTLGIASGIYLEKHANEWVAVKMPDYHAAGASKFMRWECFRNIGGFIPSMGWDTVDEIRAQMLGWKTQHFPEIKFYHLRAEGTAGGLLHTNVLQGEGYFLTGGGMVFLLLKVVHRMALGKPVLIGGMAMLWGYVRAWLRGRKRITTAREAHYYRRMLNGRLLHSAEALLKRAKPDKEEWSPT